MIYKEEDLNLMTKFELLRIATDLEVPYRTRMAKPMLINSILETLSLKKKDFDPNAEASLAEQKAFYDKSIEEAKAEQEISAAKFSASETPEAPKKEEQFVPPASSFSSPLPQGTIHEDWDNFPDGYGDDKIVTMIIDPTHIHAYWEITESRKNQIMSQANVLGAEHDLVVRLYDVTDVAFNGYNAWSWKEYCVNFSRNWYFDVEDNRSYCADLGLKLKDDRFLLLVRSNIIHTPRASVSDFYDEEWMMIDFNKNKDMYNEMYRLSGGYYVHRYQLNSAFMTETHKIDKGININLPSSHWSSASLSSEMMVKKSKDFWLWVDTELTVYGQTKADASELTINDVKVNLDAEGRFKLHLALPNGDYPFHVRAVSKDGSMVEEVTPEVVRYIKQEKARVKG